MTDQVRKRMLVRGRVQGVGFRWFARDTAEDLGLSGTVRNLSDGRTVEVVAEGQADTIARFREALRQGPPAAYVAELEEHDEPPTNERDGFRITR